ncbi:MAG TPA: radical SAM protein [bacterium]|nr:radical SAM protein [bacterium]
MGSFLKLARAACGKTPFHLVFFVTAKCNARCKYCFYWKQIVAKDKPQELSLREIEKVTANLPNLGYLTLTGGETSLREDVAEIAEAFYERSGIRIASYHTNGFLKDKIIADVSAILDRCPELAVDVCVSVDGVGEKHDRLKGVPGAFDKAISTIEALKRLHARNGRLGIFTVSVFCASNTSEDILEVHRYLADMGVRNGISLIRNASKDRGEFDVDMNEYLRLFEELERIRPKGENAADYPLFSFRDAIESFKGQLIAETASRRRQIVPCVAGLRSIVLGEDGTLYPCELLHTQYGNVRDCGYDPMALVNSLRGHAMRRGIVNRDCYCTWEILIALSALYWPWVYPRVVGHRLRQVFKSGNGRQ